jgi:hypothetical protein
MATEGPIEDQQSGQQPDKPVGLVQVRIVAPTDMAGAPSYYSNFVQVGMSPYEFTLHFSRVAMPLISEPPTEPLKLDVIPQPVANISIPLNLVRGVIKALQGQVENWETTFDQSLPTEPSQRPAKPREPQPGSSAEGVKSE